jgi:hypothetical protein
MSSPRLSYGRGEKPSSFCHIEQVIGFLIASIRGWHELTGVSEKRKIPYQYDVLTKNVIANLIQNLKHQNHNNSIKIKNFKSSKTFLSRTKTSLDNIPKT